MATFAKWLLEQRNRRNFSQTELAERLGLHPRSITRMESGGTPNRNNLRRIARFFEVDPEQLVSAVFRQSGEFPAVPENGSGLQIPVLVGEKLRQIAADVGKEPVQWLEELLEWVESASDLRSLIPARTDHPPFDEVIGVKTSNPPRRSMELSQANTPGEKRRQ